MHTRIATLAVLALGIALPALAADPLPLATPESVGMSSERLARLGEVLRADVENDRLPGAVIAIARRGKLVHFEAIGYRDKAAGAPMTNDAIFGIASMTKPMVTAGARMLYEQGRLLMNDPISKFFPQFADTQVAVMSEDGQRIVDTVAVDRPITVQDLMRHTSGIIYGNRGTTAVHKASTQALGRPQATLSGPEFIDALASVPLLYQPGTVWDYGYSIDVVGQLIEHLSGQTLGEYLKANLFDPLGMVDTGFLLPDQDQDRYAQVLPEDPLSGRPQSTRDATTPLTFECGGGCAISTASDYLRFALMLLNDGALGDTCVLGRKTVEYMLSNHLGPDVENLIAAADPTRADYSRCCVLRTSMCSHAVLLSSTTQRPSRGRTSHREHRTSAQRSPHATRFLPVATSKWSTVMGRRHLSKSLISSAEVSLRVLHVENAASIAT